MATATASRGRIGSVDRKRKIIYGAIVAEEGDFKSGRGSFTAESLSRVEKLLREQVSTKVRFGHPDGTTAEALASFVGWAKNPRRDGPRVRADIHLSPVSFTSLSGATSKGEHLLDRAEYDPDSLGMSLALDADQRPQLDSKGHPLFLSDGRMAPPVWLPTIIDAVDLVDDPDATHHGLLSRPRRPTPIQEAIRLRARWALGRATRQLEETFLRRLWLANRRKGATT